MLVYQGKDEWFSGVHFIPGNRYEVCMHAPQSEKYVVCNSEDKCIWVRKDKHSYVPVVYLSESLFKSIWSC